MNTRTDSPMDALAQFNQRLLEQVFRPLARDGTAPDAPEMMKSLAVSLSK